MCACEAALHQQVTHLTYKTHSYLRVPVTAHPASTSIGIARSVATNGSTDKEKKRSVVLAPAFRVIVSLFRTFIATTNQK
jgi:hypothetical protein